MHGRYVTDILKVYMKKFIAEKFVQIFTGFRFAHCGEFTVHVSLACSKFLVGLGFSCHFISYCKLFICKLT